MECALTSTENLRIPPISHVDITLVIHIRYISISLPLLPSLGLADPVQILQLQPRCIRLRYDARHDFQRRFTHAYARMEIFSLNQVKSGNLGASESWSPQRLPEGVSFLVFWLARLARSGGASGKGQDR